MDKTLDQLAQDPTSSRFVRNIVELAQGRDLTDVANDLHVLAIAAHKAVIVHHFGAEIVAFGIERPLLTYQPSLLNLLRAILDKEAD